MVLNQLQRISKAQQRCQLSWNLISDNSWVLIADSGCESLGLTFFSCFLHENLNKTAIYKYTAIAGWCWWKISENQTGSFRSRCGKFGLFLFLSAGLSHPWPPECRKMHEHAQKMNDMISTWYQKLYIHVNPGCMADIDAGCFLYSAEQNFMGLRCRPVQHSEPQCSCLEPNSAMIFLFKDIQSTNMTRVLRASNALDQI